MYSTNLFPRKQVKNKSTLVTGCNEVPYNPIIATQVRAGKYLPRQTGDLPQVPAYLDKL
jgi:hypothetical protein